MSKCWIVMGCVQLHFSVVVCTFDNRLSCTLHNVLFVQYLFTFQPNKLRHTLKINRHFTPHNIALCLLQELELQTCVFIGYRAIVLYKEHIVHCTGGQSQPPPMGDGRHNDHAGDEEERVYGDGGRAG